MKTIKTAEQEINKIRLIIHEETRDSFRLPLRKFMKATKQKSSAFALTFIILFISFSDLIIIGYDASFEEPYDFTRDVGAFALVGGPPDAFVNRNNGLRWSLRGGGI